MIYSFSTCLLSAEKTGYPNLIGTSLSAVGVTFLSGSNIPIATQQVVVVSLSTTDMGLAFNPVSVTVGTNSLSTFNLSSYSPVTVNMGGSEFIIPPSLDTSTLAVVKTIPGEYTAFPWLSSTTTVPTSAFESTRDVNIPNSRRLWVYGYI